MMQFTVKHAGTGTVFYSSPPVEAKGRHRPVQWRFDVVWFEIAGRLRPGDYVLDLTIDDHPAGQYHFAVVSGASQ